MIKWLADKTCISLTASVLPFAQLYGTGKTGTKDKVQDIACRADVPSPQACMLTVCCVLLLQTDPSRRRSGADVGRWDAEVYRPPLSAHVCIHPYALAHTHMHTHRHCSATVRGVSQGPIFTGLDSSTTYFPAFASYGSSTKPVVKVC